MSSSIDFKELTIDVGYGNVACKVWGETSATQKFLALHGWLDNAGTFDSLMEYFLTDDRCVVCIDLPGHGLSSHLPKGVFYTTERVFYAMKCVVRHLGWKKYYVMGHSLGANRCQTYCMFWPEEIEAIISFDGFIMPAEIVPTELMEKYNLGDVNAHLDSAAKDMDDFLSFTFHLSRKNKEYNWEKLTDKWLKAVRGLTLDDVKVLARRGVKQLENGSYIYTRDSAVHLDTSTLLRYSINTIQHRLQKMKGVPQLAIINSSYGIPEGGQVLTNFLIKKLVEVYPSKFEVVTIEGAHHFVMQQPRLVSSIVNNFLHEISKEKPSSKL